MLGMIFKLDISFSQVCTPTWFKAINWIKLQIETSSMKIVVGSWAHVRMLSCFELWSAWDILRPHDSLFPPIVVALCQRIIYSIDWLLDSYFLSSKGGVARLLWRWDKNTVPASYENNGCPTLDWSLVIWIHCMNACNSRSRVQQRLTVVRVKTDLEVCQCRQSSHSTPLIMSSLISLLCSLKVGKQYVCSSASGQAKAYHPTKKISWIHLTNLNMEERDTMQIGVLHIWIPFWTVY